MSLEQEKPSMGIQETQRRPEVKPEARQVPGRENQQRDIKTEQQKSDALKAEQIRIELRNYPVVALITPEPPSLPPPENQEAKLGFWEILELILEKILGGGKEFLPMGKK